MDLENVFVASAEAENPVMAVWAMGLTPMSPVTDEFGTLEMPDLARMAKLAAVPRFTSDRPTEATARVVKLQATGLSMAAPAACLAAVLTVAV